MAKYFMFEGDHVVQSDVLPGISGIGATKLEAFQEFADIMDIVVNGLVTDRVAVDRPQEEKK